MDLSRPRPQESPDKRLFNIMLLWTGDSQGIPSWDFGLIPTIDATTSRYLPAKEILPLLPKAVRQDWCLQIWRMLRWHV